MTVAATSILTDKHLADLRVVMQKSMANPGMAFRIPEDARTHLDAVLTAAILPSMLELRRREWQGSTL